MQPTAVTQANIHSITTHGTSKEMYVSLLEVWKKKIIHFDLKSKKVNAEIGGY